MAFTVRVTQAAAKALRKLHPHEMKRVTAAIRGLAEEPQPAGSIRVVGGGGELRIRVGHYRVIYEVHDAELLVLVIKLGHRGDVYR